MGLFDTRLTETGLDQRYIELCDKELFAPRRAQLESMWELAKPYLDRNFSTEFARHTQDRFWEMYLCCTLLNEGHTVCERRKGAGPDFRVKLPSGEIAVEAIASGAGNEENAMSLPPDGEAGFISLEPAVLRIKNAVDKKRRKYDRYLEKGCIESECPYVIAVSLADVALSMLQSPDGPIIRALFPVGQAVFSYTEGASDGRIVYPPCDSVQVSKQGKDSQSVATGIFFDHTYAGVSAVTFSNAPTMLDPQGHEFVTVLNPKALHPLSHSLTPGTTLRWRDGKVVE